MTDENRKSIAIAEKAHQVLASITGALQVEAGQRIKMRDVLSDIITMYTVDQWLKMIAEKNAEVER